ncbi:MAG: aminomethyl-transferring glycine dehydrogenase subunit GcvPB [Chloroflexi bacterium]|nr:aminomethyl-transferring glycine dehydrogenase subunit GcvPB [Chloroflexota bacterium]
MTAKRDVLFERSKPGIRGCTLPALDVPPSDLPDASLLRQELPLPEVSEADLVRYFTALSRLNYSVDAGFYPLGSCTMKYNPKWHEALPQLPGFSQLHPLQSAETVQGALRLMFELQEYLAEIVGMEATSLAPMAGAQGELTGIMVARAYQHDRGQAARDTVLVPDTAHGTNAATVAMCGFQQMTVKSNRQGDIDLDSLRSQLSDRVAALMLTIPNTLGLFDRNILGISRLVHDCGALLYCDGANQNAVIGRTKMGELGFDIIQLNLHKTFSTPHGGGGPGAGPVCVKGFLKDFLPTPVVTHGTGEKAAYAFARPAKSIGRLGTFYGNFAVLVKAYAYIRTLGAAGLREVSDNAVINANYLMSKLRDDYHLPYDRHCLHEFVLSASQQKTKGVTALDVAKRLLDFGFHPPTIYFPLVVSEALMIEPTETESRETLDDFVSALKSIAKEAQENPEVLHSAPHSTPVRRLDEVGAARKPKLRWTPKQQEDIS